MNTMRIPSRLLPPRTIPRLDWRALLLMMAMLTGCGYVIYSMSAFVRYMTAALVCCAVVYIRLGAARSTRQFARLARSRHGESICQFARSFDTRTTDTWIIRAAHQDLQTILQPCVADFPVRASDSLIADLGLDLDDVEDLLLDIAQRCHRSLEQTEENPYYEKVHTAMDLVLFINAQPKTSAT